MADNQIPRAMIPNSTQIPNVLFETVMPVVSPGVWKIICCIGRQTYGWWKKWDTISVPQIEKKTGLSNRFVIDSLELLVLSGLAQRGERKEFGYEYCLNTECDLEKALAILQPKERAPRKQHSGGKKKANGAYEPGSQGYEPSSPPCEQSSYEPSSQEAMNHVPESYEPSSQEAMNPVHPQNKLSKLIKTNSQKGEQTPPPVRPISQSVLIIAQRQMMEFVFNPRRAEQRSTNCHGTAYDRSLFDDFRTGAKNAGLSLRQAKEFLMDHPDWREWHWLQFLDSQEEIEFPEPEKAPPRKPNLPADLDPNRGRELWRGFLDSAARTVSRHNFETWLKPTRAFGVSGNVLYVHVPTPEFRHIGEKFSPELAEFRKQQDLVDVKLWTHDDAGTS